MFKINVISFNETIVFAAEELKKYLRMMMPEAGNFNICFNSEANDGIRLGLMQDFGLDVSDVEDTVHVLILSFRTASLAMIRLACCRR